MNRTAMQPIYDYHRDSKHRPERYAPGPGGLDWANQPDPFRVFEGAAGSDLPFRADDLGVRFADIRRGKRPPPAALDLDHIGALLELSFGLSAWKAIGGSRWALRCNPSSGNLHPTECYVATAARPGIAAGVYHYVSRDHRLEARALAGGTAWEDGLADGLVLGLSSVHWREAWKYGLRAYRYCQHDAGHGIAALAYAAAVLGWRVTLLPWSDAELAAVLGLDRADEFPAGEQEAPDMALWVGPRAPPDAGAGGLSAAHRRFFGVANRLSRQHRPWPGIDAVQRACERPGEALAAAEEGMDLPPLAPIVGEIPAAGLIRRRRSAVAFDGLTSLTGERWFALLDALLPRPEVPPLDAWPPAPRVHPVLFVHRIDGVAPGLYLLARNRAAVPDLRRSLHSDWLWHPVPGAPAHLPLYCLLQTDLRGLARFVSCHQEIAADSCFAVAMLAGFDAALQEGPWRYRELFWECGMLGQILYLEAEAAGVRGTGIGCFFDDAVHELLGIEDTRWQSLYHFTVGGPVQDVRLQTYPPYSIPRSSASTLVVQGFDLMNHDPPLQLSPSPSKQ